MLYGAEFAGCYGACVATGADGMFTPGSAEAHEYCGGVECAGFLHGYPGMPHPGATAGYIIDSPASSFAPSNMYYGIVPDYHVEWHYIDGTVSQTGLGDIVGEDEDGDGTYTGVTQIVEGTDFEYKFIVGGWGSFESGAVVGDVCDWNPSDDRTSLKTTPTTNNKFIFKIGTFNNLSNASVSSITIFIFTNNIT
jgi:hypothetical protein